jgi:hypothetical protein
MNIELLKADLKKKGLKIIDIQKVLAEKTKDYTRPSSRYKLRNVIYRPDKYSLSEYEINILVEWGIPKEVFN